jgi:2-methylcitrate dehydratase PrpD
MKQRSDSSVEPRALASLAQFATQLNLHNLPIEIISRGQACLLYGLSVGIASKQAMPARVAAAAIDAECGSMPMNVQATRLLDGKRMLAGQAAFANAALFHARIQEDAHPTGHVGVIVVPAALAVAEWRGASGPALLGAIVAGYEVALRIGRDHAADTSKRGFRTTPLYGVFGAAAATASLMRLSATQMRNALALAANNACGLREFVNEGTEEYTLHAGFAARNGIASALCASANAQAAATTLEGPAGFHASYGMPLKHYDTRMVDALGEQFELQNVTYKPYPTCQFHRAVVTGVLALRERLGKRPLERMRILMNPFEADFIGVRHAGPYHTFAQTFMSAPFCAALAWERGAVTYDGLHAFGDAGIAADVARIEVIADDEVPRYQPRVEIRCADGTGAVWSETPDPAAYSLTWDSSVAMAHALGGEAGIAPATLAALVDAVEQLSHVDGRVDTLIDAVRAVMASD